jgi:hypothetical protein
VVQILGRAILIYKRHPQKPRYEGRKAAEKAAEKAVEAKRATKPTRRRKK